MNIERLTLLKMKKSIHMKKSLLYLSIAGLIAFGASCKEEDPKEKNDPNATEFTVDGTTVTVKDNGSGFGNYTLSADTTYILDGMVFVNDGQKLTIEPGTVIKGKRGEGEDASALVVARGAQIFANGTAEKPIILTSVEDEGNLDNSHRGLWGGLIVLGSARLNTVPSTMNIEGIPTNEARGQYGGTNDDDNSGVIKYVSIRHGGTNIGADNEINGLTLGGVGSGTTIDYVEIYANNDDGIEFFGGKPKVSHAVIAYCKDDSFDYDQGFRGYGQYWLAIQDADNGDRLGELDGADDPEDGTPFADPVIYNATLIGRGADAGKKVMTFRANGGGKWYNSIFVNQKKGVDIEVKQSYDSEHSIARLNAGDLEVTNNLFWDVAGNDLAKVIKMTNSDKKPVSSADSTKAVADLNAKLATWNNSVEDPGLSYSDLLNVNPVPSNSAVVTKDLAAKGADSFFEDAQYKGAFDPAAENWAKGWTKTFN